MFYRQVDGNAFQSKMTKAFIDFDMYLFHTVKTVGTTTKKTTNCRFFKCKKKKLIKMQ